jgi:hypothetical protein
LLVWLRGRSGKRREDTEKLAGLDFPEALGIALRVQAAAFDRTEDGAAVNAGRGSGTAEIEHGRGLTWIRLVTRLANMLRRSRLMKGQEVARLL